MTIPINPNFSFETKSEVLNKLKISSSTLYRNIDEGLWPPPIQIGNRAVRFEISESKLVIEAIISGKSKEEIKTLVRQIKKSRISGELK